MAIPLGSDEPFPKNEQGRLINPAAVEAEGERIRQAIAAGTYGSLPGQAAAAAVGAPQITVAPVSQDPFAGLTGFDQASWNIDPAQQRRDLELDVLRTTAAKHKLDLEQEAANAPTKSRLLQAQADAMGAHERFLEDNNAQTLEHTAGFFNAMADPNAPRRRDPGYVQYVYDALDKNRAFARTPGGREILRQMAADQKSSLSIDDMKSQIPEGFKAASVSIGSDGKERMTIKPVAADDVALEKESKSAYKLTLGQIRNPTAVEVGKTVARPDGTKGFDGDEKGNIVRVKNGQGIWVPMSVDEYQKFGGKFSPQTISARGGNATGASPADISQAEYAKLESGKPYYFHGKQFTKQ